MRSHDCSVDLIVPSFGFDVSIGVCVAVGRRAGARLNPGPARILLASPTVLMHVHRGWGREIRKDMS